MSQFTVHPEGSGYRVLSVNPHVLKDWYSTQEQASEMAGILNSIFVGMPTWRSSMLRYKR